MRIFLLVAALVGSLLPVQAQFIVTNDLVNYMRENERGEAGQSGADMYQAGIYDGYVIATAEAYEKVGLICTPENAKVEQIKAVVAAYLKSHETDWHYSATTTVAVALTEAFPCG